MRVDTAGSSQRPNNTSIRGIRINISSDPFQNRIPSYFQRTWQESRVRKCFSVCKRRLKKHFQRSSWIELSVLGFGLAVCCIFLLVHVGFFNGGKYQDWQSEHYEDSIAATEVDLLDKVYPDEGNWQTTAIILISKQEDIQAANSIAEFLCEYDMFESFIVWNNDPETQLSNEIVKGCSHKKIKIINSPVNVGVTEKPRIRSVYSNFLKSTHLIHGESSSYDSYVDSQWRYCFSNEDINLHACYMRMETGSFIAKETAVKFVTRYNDTKIMDKSSADIYFSLYMNQIPYQMEGHGDLVSSLEEAEIEHLNYGLETLYNDLSNDKLILSQPRIDNWVDYHTRAACKLDQCLFLTNIKVFPNLELFSYNPTIAVATSKKMHDDYLNEKDQTSFYQNAVDGNDLTSWKSTYNIRKGDYIGLDLLISMRIPLKYRLVIRDFYRYKAGLRIQTSYDNLNWLPLHTLPNTKCTNPEQESDKTLFECYFIITRTAYRYIRLESLMDHDFKFDVYDFSFSGKVKKDSSGQMLDISFEDDSIVFIDDEQ